MANDPAFLFYSKDWLQGTAKFMPEEKGVYIDLLCHQHQDGYLPNDTKRLSRMVGMLESEFIPIWEVIKCKFTLNDINQFVNKKLTKLVKERTDVAHTNKIISALAVAVRQSKEPYEIKMKAKFGFNVNDFKSLKTTEITEKVTEWFTKRITLALNGNGNGNGNNINIDDCIINENEKNKIQTKAEEDMIVPEMNKIWKQHNPSYPASIEEDYHALLQIAYQIAASKGWKKSDVIEFKKFNTLVIWENTVKFISNNGSKFIKSMTLDGLSIKKNWQKVVNEFRVHAETLENQKNDAKSIEISAKSTQVIPTSHIPKFEGQELANLMNKFKRKINV